jgi:hypothetical protein
MYGIDESTLIDLDRDGSGLFQLVHISGVSHLSTVPSILQWIEN